VVGSGGAGGRVRIRMDRRPQRPQRSDSVSPSRRTLTLSPLLGLSGRVTSRRSWSPQHQSSLEVPTPRQVQSARNSLTAPIQPQGSVEVIVPLTQPPRLILVFVSVSSRWAHPSADRPSQPNHPPPTDDSRRARRLCLGLWRPNRCLSSNFFLLKLSSLCLCM
jgi:hypothetical protein